MIATQVLKRKDHKKIKVNELNMANVDILCTCLSGRADPECVLGHLLKILFKNDDFMNAVIIFKTMFMLIN